MNATPRQRLAEIALEAAKAHYTELWERWKAIDTKAQATAAVGGVAITAIFAFLRDYRLLGVALHVLTSSAVVVIFFAALFAILALRIRYVVPPPLGESTTTMVDEILSKDGDDDQTVAARLPRLLNDQRQLWQKTNASNEEALESKATWLERAQWVLLAGLFLLGVLTVIRVIVPPTSGSPNG